MANKKWGFHAGKLICNEIEVQDKFTVKGTGEIITNVNALTPGATITVNSTTGNTFTLTPAQTGSINATTVGSAGQFMYLIITTSGTNSYTLTFGTNFKSTGTLATGTVSGAVFTLSFISDGTNYNEVSRTVAM